MKVENIYHCFFLGFQTKKGKISLPVRMQYRIRRETEDSRDLTSIQDREFHGLSVPQLFSMSKEENCVDKIMGGNLNAHNKTEE